MLEAWGLVHVSVRVVGMPAVVVVMLIVSVLVDVVGHGVVLGARGLDDL